MVMALMKALKPAGSKHTLSTHLSDELKGKYGRRSLPLRKEDGVVVIKGDYKGVEGTVMRVDVEKEFVYVEGVTRESAEGKQILVPLRPTCLVIKKLKLDDKFRQGNLREKPIREGSEDGK
jgi:large subunit ribosomal protein L24